MTYTNYYAYDAIMTCDAGSALDAGRGSRVPRVGHSHCRAARARVGHTTPVAMPHAGQQKSSMPSGRSAGSGSRQLGGPPQRWPCSRS